MDHLDIQVGRTYIVEIPWDENDTDPPKVLTEIKGAVLPNTHEYEEGYRYYTQIGVLLFGNGSTTLTDDNPLRLRLKRLAVAEDFKNSLTASTSVTVAMVDLENCEAGNRWIANSDPNFSLKLGEVYADRMGFMQFVDKVRNLSEDPVFVADGSCFDVTGRYLNSDADASQVPSKPSMRDLIFQRL